MIHIWPPLLLGNERLVTISLPPLGAPVFLSARIRRPGEQRLFHKMKKLILFLCMAALAGLGGAGCAFRNQEVSYEIPATPTPAPSSFGPTPAGARSTTSEPGR